MTEIKNIDYPIRPREHAVGDRAVEVFKVRLPREWVKNESKKDYGWDIWLTITKDKKVRENFFTQLKGSDSPNYIENGKTISHPLKVSTVNWLLSLPMPIMLCICDTGHDDEPVYYVWLQEDINRIKKENPAWRKQGSVVFHVPTSQIISKDKINEIQEYVEKYYDNLKIDAAIGEMLGSSFGFEKSDPISFFAEGADRVVSEKVSPAMMEAGIVDIVKESGETSIEPLSTEDQKRFKEIKKSSMALDSFRDKDAQNILDDLKSEIEHSSDGIKARYYNNIGALSLHLRDYKAALESFRKAEELRPEQPKYISNSLLAEYLLLLPDSDDKTIKFPNTWINRLKKVISEHYDFYAAIRLKATFLGATKGADKAEEYIRSTKAWDEEHVACCCELSEVYKDEGNWDKAIELLLELEEKGEKLSWSYWSLYGTILLQKGIGEKSRQSSSVIKGPGPSLLDIKTLRKAEQCLIKACEGASYVGFPLISQMAVANLAVVQRLLGKTDEAKHFSKAFLIQHPSNPEVATALAGCLIAENDILSTIKHSKIAYETDPSNKTNYQNYLISLYQSEDYDALLELISGRKEMGFTDEDEESLSLSFYAIALNEIGEESKAIDKLKEIKNIPYIVEDATVAEAIIARKNGLLIKDVAEIYRRALKDYPNSMILLTHFIDHLDSFNQNEAKEKLECLRKIANLRQLLPYEIHELGMCYITLKDYENAVRIFEEGEKRYPHEGRLLYGHASALSELGDEEGTYNVLKRYVELGKKDYNVLRNFAFSALETGRLEEAIRIFQKAANKAKEDEERAELHCQLWELKRRGGYPAKEILRHVMSFGQTFSDDPEKEARFLMMAMLSPFPEEVDSKVKEWHEEIRERLKDFSEKHPQFPYFMSFKIPEDVPEEERGSHILTQLTAVMLPHYLAAVPFRLASRSEPFPLVFRAEHLPEFKSIFDFWASCISSKDFFKGIHIWFDYNPIGAELETISKRDKVCVDINALLTLAELDLLNLLPKYFNQIILARETKRTIDDELFRINGPHPIVNKIEEWRLRYRSMIRIRNITDEIDTFNDEENYQKTGKGIFIKPERPINKILRSGVGESLLLSKNLNIPLYSDDSFIRKLGIDAYGVNGFSTISLIKKLRTEDHLSLQEETSILCEMIRKNYRVVRFNQDHLNSCLNEIIVRHEKREGKIPSREDLLKDSDMGTLLRQFSDTFFNETWLANIIQNWWASLLQDEKIRSELIVECIDYPCFALSMRTTCGVIKGMKKYEQEDRLAHILGYLLLKSYDIKNRPIDLAWSATKSCCERIFSHDEHKYNRTLFVLLPKWIINELQDMRITDEERLNIVIIISSAMSAEDRDKFDRRFIKLKPAFMNF